MMKPSTQDSVLMWGKKGSSNWSDQPLDQDIELSFAQRHLLLRTGNVTHCKHFLYFATAFDQRYPHRVAEKDKGLYFKL